MRHLVEGQGEQQDAKPDEDLREVDVYGSLTGGLRISNVGLRTWCLKSGV
jgi:hypothetical protein